MSLNSILISLPAEETQQHPLGAPWRQCPVQVPEFLQATIPISTRTEQSAALARSPANDSWSHKYEMRYAYVNRTEPAASPLSPAGPVPPEPPARRPRYLVLTPEPTGRARGSSTHFFDEEASEAMVTASFTIRDPEAAQLGQVENLFRCTLSEEISAVDESLAQIETL